MTFLKSGQPIHTIGKNLAGLWRPSFVKTDKKLYVFGGGGNVTHDLHALHFDDMRWETIQAVEGISPSKRYGHTATRWNNSFIIFGGCNEFQEYCSDIHIFDLDTLTWSQPTINGSVSARYLHTSVVYNDKLFVYGGFAKSSDCTYVLEEMNILDLKTMIWSRQHDVHPRYNHSATLVGSKMYIYGGKDEHGNTVSDLFVINLQSTTQHYACHLVLSGAQNTQMALVKSQHFCDAVCGKLLVFGRFMMKSSALLQQQQQQQQQLQQQQQQQQPSDSNLGYSLWMLDLDTLEWERQDCDAHFEVGGWNYFTIIKEIHPGVPTLEEDTATDQSQAITHHLLFLGNTDPYRPQGYDHFRDALVINGESLGLYDISPGLFMSEFAPVLNNPELSDFMIVPSNGQPIHVHQVILMTRWPHFRNIYKSGMVESMDRRIEIPESHQVVMAFLKYLYTDQLDETEPWPVVCELLVVANMYLQHRLKKLCCQRLYQRHLTVGSCGMIFEKAILADETGLKILTLDFMFRHYGSVLKSNVLMHVSPFVQHAFLEAVPEEAVLEVGRSRFLSSAFSTTATTIPHSFSHGILPVYAVGQMDTDETMSASQVSGTLPLYMSSSTSSSSSSSSSSSTSSATLSPSISQQPQQQPLISSATPQRVSGVTGLQRTTIVGGMHSNSVEV